MIETYHVGCPYCGETYEAIIDGSVGDQRYIEDCEVCCRPILFDISVDSRGDLVVETYHEDDA